MGEDGNKNDNDNIHRRSGSFESFGSRISASSKRQCQAFESVQNYRKYGESLFLLQKQISSLRKSYTYKQNLCKKLEAQLKESNEMRRKYLQEIHDKDAARWGNLDN